MKQEFGFSGGGPKSETAAFRLGPVLAGARARGMADAMTMLNLAAIFLDADGGVIFANNQARALMGEHLRSSDDRLQASVEAAEALRSLVASTLANGRLGASPMLLPRGAGRPALRLRAAAALGDEPFQLVKVVVIIDDRRDKRGRPRLRRSLLQTDCALRVPH
jgi:hypothetical protein